MRLHFIRHTRPDIARGICYGQSDIPLASSFPEEVEDVRQRLAERLEGHTPYRVYSSPLSRCRRLAEALGYAAPLLDERLLELNFGAWELQKFEDITDPRLQLWYDDYLHVAPTGGESFVQQAERVAHFIEELRHEAIQSEDSSVCDVLVFTHGGVLLSAGLWAGWYSLEEAFSHQSPYGAICTLEL